MSRKLSPEAQAQVDKAVKYLSDWKEGRLPKETRTPEQIKAAREAWIDKSIADRKARYEKDMAEQRARIEEQRVRDKANLAELEKRHAELKEIHEKGKYWKYADSEQNLGPDERKAREIEPTLNRLAMRIEAAKSDTSYSKGGKIDLRDCKVSTHEKKSKSKNSW